jgi:tetratricopeptide (TPR) repeat protein
LQEGDLLQSQGKYKDALKCYENCLLENPKNATAYLHTGIALRHLGRLEVAGIAFQKSLELREDPNGYNNLGEVYHRLGRYEEAIWAYESAIGMASRVALFHHNKGVAFLSLAHQERDQKKQEELLENASEAFDRAIEIERSLSLAYIAKGLILFLQKKEENLSLFFEEATHANVLSVSGIAPSNLFRLPLLPPTSLLHPPSFLPLSLLFPPFLFLSPSLPSSP